MARPYFFINLIMAMTLVVASLSQASNLTHPVDQTAANISKAAAAAPKPAIPTLILNGQHVFLVPSTAKVYPDGRYLLSDGSYLSADRTRWYSSQEPGYYRSADGIRYFDTAKHPAVGQAMPKTINLATTYNSPAPNGGSYQVARRLIDPGVRYGTPDYRIIDRGGMIDPPGRGFVDDGLGGRGGGRRYYNPDFPGGGRLYPSPVVPAPPNTGVGVGVGRLVPWWTPAGMMRLIELTLRKYRGVKGIKGTIARSTIYYLMAGVGIGALCKYSKESLKGALLDGATVSPIPPPDYGGGDYGGDYGGNTSGTQRPRFVLNFEDFEDIDPDNLRGIQNIDQECLDRAIWWPGFIVEATPDEVRIILRRIVGGLIKRGIIMTALVNPEISSEFDDWSPGELDAALDETMLQIEQHRAIEVMRQKHKATIQQPPQ